MNCFLFKFSSVLICILFAGCILPFGSERSYPPEWPNITKLDSKVANLSGRYIGFGQNAAATNYPEECASELFGLFGSGKGFDPNFILKIENLNTDQIRVSVFVKGKIVNQRELSRGKGEFEYSDGGLLFPRKSETSVGAGGGSRSWGDARLYLANDGSLIGKFYHSSTSLILVIPVYTSFHRWCHFSIER